MPAFEWDDEDMRHAIAFLPLTGIVIGAASYGVLVVSGRLGLPVFVVVVLLSLVPLLVTGGFHLDGFMDVTDARKSYLDSAKKLQIMKDPHVGAFAVIGLLVYAMVWGGSLYMIVYRAAGGAVSSGAGGVGYGALELGVLGAGVLGAAAGGNYGALMLYAMIFFVARAFCGLTCIFFPKAKKDGMLNREAGNSSRFDKAFLIAEAVAGAVLMIRQDCFGGMLAVLGLVLFTVYYWRMCKKEFGGVTGDTAGYFVAVSEEVMVVLLAIRAML